MRVPCSPAMIACVLVVALAGCGRSDTTTLTTSEGTVTTTANGDGGTMTVTGPNGAVAQFGTGISTAQLPTFLPLYPGAKVLTSVTSPDTNMLGGSVAFETTAAVADVINFYKQKASGEGLKEALNMSTADGMTFMANKDKTMMQVIATKSASSTDVVLSWTVPK